MNLTIGFCACALMLAGWGPMARGATPPKMELSKVVEVIPERGEVLGYVLAVDDFRIRFIPPPGARAHVNEAASTLTLLSAEVALVLQYRREAGSARAGLDDALLEQRVSASYGQAEILERFDVFASNQEGKGFDLQLTSGPDEGHQVRVAIIPIRNAVLEVSLRGALSERERRIRWTHFLNSLSIQ